MLDIQYQKTSSVVQQSNREIGTGFSKICYLKNFFCTYEIDKEDICGTIMGKCGQISVYILSTVDDQTQMTLSLFI